MARLERQLAGHGVGQRPVPTTSARSGSTRLRQSARAAARSDESGNHGARVQGYRALDGDRGLRKCADEEQRGGCGERDPVEDRRCLVDGPVPDLRVVGVVQPLQLGQNHQSGSMARAQSGSDVPSTSHMAPTASRNVSRSAAKSKWRLRASLRPTTRRPKRPVFSGGAESMRRCVVPAGRTGGDQLYSRRWRRAL